MSIDHVTTVIEQWTRERPDLDASPMAIIGRLSRLSRFVEQGLEQNFKRHSLQGGTFDLLAALRRSGDPYTLTPTKLQAEMMLSSGATTHRIDLLEKQGFIERLPDPGDRRGTLIKLTDKGRELIDEAVVSHLETEAALLEGLSASERDGLAHLLTTWAKSVKL